MNVKTISMSDLFTVCEDIYTNVVIVAKRAKQIIDDRVIPIAENENEDVEDSIQLQEAETNIDTLEKPMVVALEEYLSGDLEWRRVSEDDVEKNES